ncbi:N-acetylmuramoyl-L-alanine amidase [Virgibacillus sp. NKC19-3]|uniref:N-acetylmuramoyl-L-alanine amidase n=1 Tax=Virgibacillus saliphilus TaxID=2831674 RepID=UPI001C9BAEC6|nr:N-acetylmuramoyl-L-alanine amidase [Virgibacillus sp. NKC19-3]MBY7141993.1 N-acetylmuramoyl-L-alanine amidase [Virgibacillus sp. NKC19-3]
MKKTIIIGISFLVFLCSFLPTAQAESGQLYNVDSKTLNLRNAPDPDAIILAELKNGANVTIFQESHGWGKTFYNGEEGWVALHLLDEGNNSTNGTISDPNETSEVQLNTEKEASETEPDQNDNDAASEQEESAAETKEREENQASQEKQHSDNTLSDYHFVIDPGHGGKDSGAIRSEVQEKTLALSTGIRVEEQLHDKGASVTLTRTDDTFISLGERVQMSNSTNADAFISLHYNTFEDQSIRGIHTFYDVGGMSQRLADTIQQSLIHYTGLHDRGARQADYEVLTANTQPALLIELGFISNPEERELVQTDNYQEKAAKGIVTGLEDYFN